MPHISVKMLAGRSEEQKKKLSAELVKVVNRVLGTPESHISVGIEDFSAEKWQEVFEKEITDKPNAIYKKPNYDPKSLL